MSKGEKLIWELFLFVRELMPVTEDNTRRQNEWATLFHQMEHLDSTDDKAAPATKSKK